MFANQSISGRFNGPSDLAAAAAGKSPVSKGCKGSGVQSVQQALLDLGYLLPVTTKGGTAFPDGVFGKETDSAVRAFQKQHGLSVDGDVGPNTLRELDQALAVEDLRPLIAAVRMLLATVRAVQRNRAILHGHGAEVVAHLAASAARLRVALLHLLPRSKLRTALRPGPLPVAWARAQADIAWPVSIPSETSVRPASGGARTERVMASSPGVLVGNPAAVAIEEVLGWTILTLAAIVAVDHVQRMKRISWPRIGPRPAAPPPDLAPLLKLQILMITTATILSGVAQTEVAATQARIDQCKTDNAGKTAGCAAAEAAYDAAKRELGRVMTKIKFRPYVLASKSFLAEANAAVGAYSKAVAALTTCLGCPDI